MKSAKSSSRLSKLLAAIAREKSASKGGRSPALVLGPSLLPRYKSVFSDPVRRIIE
ncbi:MAG: hypothetical protein SFU53_07630 [Terrimicrobiaceae bacterium]|nr:hypothetical protein [Terrimicrobiaceae bacterium]